MELTKIKVVGIGGAGSNTIDRLTKSRIKGVDLLSINTDIQDLKKKNAHIKLRIGEKTTKGLGSGMKPEVGKLSAKENYKQIEELLKGSDIVFLTAGLGGGTGSGATPIISEITKKLGILTVGIFTLPFSFEGKKRKKIALDSLEEIEKKVNTLIVIPNDKLINPNLPKLSVEDAFLKCDEFLKEAVESISNVITATGVLNLDFSDIKEVLKDGGTAFFGIGRSQGKDRAIKAVENALQSPITKISLKKTNGVLFNVASGTQDVLLSEIKKIAEIIKGKSLPNVKIIFGTSFDERLLKDEIRVTVIATSSEKP
ncbi:MAG TPA: cell division protein FtsZ [Candidatus Pacearchaeota archaeon]|jgi:cell division protein FtsZ|nr:cell division protein FtsZ [Candidatus Pacearchaeota archaeon]HOS12441.1 cell division protein FtsZ [Candidatus Pacearchaeota archaeon]HPL72496.1 cell division protein FtsZ [Candidatus Pacearchaeota archaeon]